MEQILAKRRLGNGRWDKILKRKLTNLSEADNYDEAKHEWKATGEVWWSGNDAIPDWVSNSQMGGGKCLCGHIVVYHFQIINTVNGVVECVGSDHINTYLIMRALKDELGEVDITDKMIQDWIDQRLKTMKSEAWWKANGENFTRMFEAVKEMDLHFNYKAKETYSNRYFDRETERYYYRKFPVKRSKGEFGSPYYQMASITWRWNNESNAKNQLTTRGYPTDKLMQDLSYFYVQCLTTLKEPYENHLSMMQRRKDRVLEEKRLRDEKRRARIAREKEAQRKHQEYLNSDEYKEEIRRQAEQRKQRRIELEKAELERLRRVAEQQKEKFDYKGEDFEFACANYGIPMFDETWAGNAWEVKFLSDIKDLMLNRKVLSKNQIATLQSITKNHLDARPTAKQLKFLEDLGCPDFEGTKKEASMKIDELLKSRSE